MLDRGGAVDTRPSRHGQSDNPAVNASERSASALLGLQLVDDHLIGSIVSDSSGGTMQLTHFTIKNYKIIDDTGPIKVDDHVTALVGKNESGKSALMKAMWKSKNVAGARFDKLYDYPRDRFSKDRTGTQEVTQLKFALTKEEIVALSKELPNPYDLLSGEGSGEVSRRRGMGAKPLSNRSRSPVSD
jgi:hypothetical protein